MKVKYIVIYSLIFFSFLGIIFFTNKERTNRINTEQEAELIDVEVRNLILGDTETIEITNVVIYRIKEDSYILIEFESTNEESNKTNKFIKVFEKEDIKYSSDELSEYQEYEKIFSDVENDYDYKKILEKEEIEKYVEKYMN
ncbi:hypothetical protein [Haploplasma axanthum]|uniref:Uncharacterized protein n=1 Tax=Haploplasma axanthum TaxID=29552 RepID=A0A449BD62_HAPAX|nr:hypothetical protein [Haploplasma axanthum]VEU80393.1 Uncharacterised protein [Haploplasma axanthum]